MRGRYELECFCGAQTLAQPQRENIISEQLLGSSDGRIIFYSLADTLAELAKAS